MKPSFEDYVNKKLNQDSALTPSFQPGNDGELSLYAQSRIYEHYLQLAEKQSQYGASDQDFGFSA